MPCMVEDRVARRLAAILAADVAGYSRSMSADEVGTARTLRDHRAAIPERPHELGASLRTPASCVRTMLIYFGYTYCPDVCPTDLSRSAWRSMDWAPDSDWFLRARFARLLSDALMRRCRIRLL
jgi:hypothetical protein